LGEFRRKEVPLLHPLSFCVIGHPIGHSLSPALHRRLFALHETGKSCTYTRLDISPEGLEQELRRLAGYAGFNVTIPHKVAILPFLDALSEDARLCGAVNTVQVADRDSSPRLHGHNTDGVGFLRAITAAGFPLGGNTVLLGCGGAARAVLFALLSAGRDTAGPAVTIAVREQSLPRAYQLRQDALAAYPAAEIGVCDAGRLAERGGGIDLLINATPVGMGGDTEAMPVSGAVVSKAGAVFDAVYGELPTALLRAAAANGACCLDGLPMLVWQAVAAQEIWFGVRFAEEDVGTVLAGIREI